MKTSTVNGVTYELPEGWEPIESVPLGIRLQVLYVNGESCPVTFDALNYRVLQENKTRIAWQHIVAPKVMPWKPIAGEPYWSIDSMGTVLEIVWLCTNGDIIHHEIGNCYPTREAAEAARERVVVAHTGGAKWEGGV